MKIAYIARWDVSEESGILKKMAAQAREWIARGHDVRLFFLSPKQTVWGGISDLPVVAFHGDSLWRRAVQRRRIAEPILSWAPDLIYLRFSTHYPALERVVSKVPTVVEINGDDIAENRRTLPWMLNAVHRLTRGRLLRHARGMVFVTHELSRLPQFRRFGAAELVLGNGIPFAEFAQLPPPAGERPRALFIGYGGCAWHGLDKLVAIAQGSPELDFDVVGVEESSLNGSSLPDNLFLHGHLGREQYEPIAAEATLALGSLALHRAGIQEASPLKTREYLAYGLPVVMAYEDTDLASEHPLILRLPNTPDNVQAAIPAVRAFAERVRGHRIPRADVDHLDVAVKEEARLHFMERIVADSNSR